MNLDDEVRKHLRDTGEQVALTPGIVDAVRIRAAARVRRRRLLLAGVVSLAVVVVIGGSASMILDRSKQNSDSTEFVALNESSQQTEALVADATDTGESPVSVSPTYETVPAPADDADGQSEIARASVSSEWGEVVGPVPGATTEYIYSGDTVVARVGSDWFIRDESSWRQLELPDSMDVVAVDLGAGEDSLRVAGWLGDSRCSRALAIKVKTGMVWQEFALSDQLSPGLVSSIAGARLRVTDHERVLSRIEEVDVDPVCLLQSFGIDAVEAEIVDDLIYATDRKSGRVVYSLNKFGPLEVQEFIDDGPVTRSLLLRSTDEDKWSTTLLSGSRVTEIAVVDGLVMTEDLDYTIHDGQRLKRSEVIPSAAQQLIDALVTSSGTSMLYERDGKIWHQGNTGEREISSLSDQTVLWGRLGRVAAETTVVVETPQGQALFVVGG